MNTNPSQTSEQEQKTNRVHWKLKEVELLKKLIIKHHKDWKTIADVIPGRSATQCIQKYYSLQRSKEMTIWTPLEDVFVSNWVSMNGSNDFTNCALEMKNKTASECFKRWKDSLNPQIKKGKWSEQEQMLFFQAFKINKKMFVKKIPNLNRNLVSIQNFLNFSMKKLKQSELFPYLLSVFYQKKSPVGFRYKFFCLLI